MKNWFSLTWEKLIICILLLLLVFLQVSSIITESPTIGEKVHINAGYHFLTDHDFRWDPFNPPLGREVIALPLLINHAFFSDPVLFWPRIMAVFISVGLGIVMYLFAKKLFGVVEGIFALLLFIFEPNLLAQGHYATMDITLSFFMLLIIYLYLSFYQNFTYKRVIVFAAIFGLTQAVKISALPFLLIYAFFMFIYYLWEKRKRWRLFFNKKIFLKLLVFLLVTSGVVWNTYFFTWEPALGYRFDQQRPAIALAKTNPFIHALLTVPIPLGSYISTIKQTYMYNYSGLYEKDSFFAGMISRDGLPGYLYIPALMIKTPLPLLILFIVSLWYFRKRKEVWLFLVLPIATILLSVLFTKTTIVIRYILPLYPLLIIAASQSITILVRNKLSILCMILLTVWYISGTLFVFPHYITYFNGLVGGRSQGYKYLVDANLDWGQALYSLKDYQISHKKPIQLAYFGIVSPGNYGIQYERIKDENIADTAKIASVDTSGKHDLIISATCYYFCGYYHSSILTHFTLTDTIDGAILVFKHK